MIASVVLDHDPRGLVAQAAATVGGDRIAFDRNAEEERCAAALAAIS